jgi:transcription termination factor Rho
MSEPQLERSVLEAKEREELYAIADALGTKPGSRARKADLITQILRATGVELTEETTGEKPRRTRAKKAAAEAPGSGASTAAAMMEAEDARPPTAGSDGGGDQLGLTEAGGGQGPERSDGAVELQPPEPAMDAGTNGAGRGDNQTEARLSTQPPAAQENRGGLAPSQPGTAHIDRSRFDGEPGNRRNRRRRGRDRGDRVDRDLQGQGGEQQYSGEPIPVKGFLDLRDEGYGFLRTRGFLASPSDVYVSISQVRRFALRKGDEVEGACRPAGSNEKYPALLRIDTVSGLTPDEARTRSKFEDLTPLFPDEKLRLEVPGDPANVTARIVDLISPIGKGQRGLIVSPPKAGKTTVLKQIAHSIESNNPEVHLMVLLVDERPEEVTDMRRSVNGEVIASTFDRPSEEHTQVAELAMERARRLVELGRDVVIVLDGITRLARAYNLAQPASGRIMSGGIDTGALYPPKKFFGSARNIEEGGSLTILATALVETGSRMDEVIFEEFKGTGNMELRLDRKLSERRIYPALDVNASSTRHEELLFDRNQLQQVWKLRRVLNALGSEGSDAAGLQLLMDKIKTTKSNDEFLAEIAKTPAPVI